MPRWALYLTKLLATLCVTTVLVAVAATALYAGDLRGHAGVLGRGAARAAGRVVAVMALAQVGYCALFGFLGLFTRRSLIAGIAYIVVVEGVLANLDFVGRALTIVYYVRTLIAALARPAARSSCARCQEAWGMATWTKLPSAGECVLTLAGVRRGGVGAVGAVVRPQRVPRQDAGQRLTSSVRTYPG